MNAPFYSIHSGFINDPIGFGKTSYKFPDPLNENEKFFAQERFIESLETVLTRAKQFEVQLLIENNVCSEELNGKLLLQKAEDFLFLFQTIDAQNLGILLDFGHLNVTADTLDINRTQYVSEIASYIRAFHVHDNDGIEDTHWPLKPDSWILEILGQKNFSELPVVIESHFSSLDILSDYYLWFSKQLDEYI